MNFVNEKNLELKHIWSAMLNLKEMYFFFLTPHFLGNLSLKVLEIKVGNNNNHDSW